MYHILLALVAAGSVQAAERTIYIEKATIWSAMDPGYSYKDCVKPTSAEAAEICQRRQAWPVGGETVNVRAPLNRIGEASYAIVDVGGKVGWVNVADLDAKHRVVVRDTVISSEMNGGGSKIPLKAGEKVTAFAPTNLKRDSDTYFFVEFQSKEGKDYVGWLAGSALTKQPKKEVEAPAPPAEEAKTEAAAPTVSPPTPAQCAPPCNREAVRQTQSAVQKMDSAIRQSGLWLKDGNDFEKFACIHSHADLYDKVPRASRKNGKVKTVMVPEFSKEKFCSFYADKKPSFREQIKKAAVAFGLPESIIGCTLMIESALYMDPKERDEYRGLGQFGRAAVDDLRRYINMPEYKSMWKAYAPNRSVADFNSSNLRDRPDVEMQVGAVAYYMKWLLTNRLPLTGCQDCGKDPNRPNRKDISMAVAGYNWSPYGLAKLAHQSPERMRSGPPLKEETQSYLHKMDRCLEPQQHDMFAKDRSSWTYKDRGAKCAESCP